MFIARMLKKLKKPQRGDMENRKSEYLRNSFEHALMSPPWGFPDFFNIRAAINMPSFRDYLGYLFLQMHPIGLDFHLGHCLNRDFRDLKDSQDLKQLNHVNLLIM